MSTRDEVMRFTAQVEGEAQVKSIGVAFDAVGDAASKADPKAQKLIDDFEQLNKVAKAINGFASLKAQLQETGDKLFLARTRLKALEDEFSNTLEPSKRLTKELERSRAEVARLAVEQNRQTAALQRAENTIKGAGFDLNKLARAQADVRDQTARTTAELRQYGAQLANTGKQAANTGGILQRLRGVAAGLFAGLSIRGAAEGVKNVLELGDAAEKTRNQFTQLYGSPAAGEKAVASLKKFANANGLAIDATLASAAKLKNFGIDPLTGSLQALVDQNAAAGGSQEDLEGKILAVGQAWAKQKLQGEEILQLVERGVPVWELLTKATGKNVAELQKLSEAGKLGRKEISALIAEIGKMNSGAAAKNANTLSGLFTQLSSRVRQFFTDVSNKGPLDFFKGQLRDAIALVERLSRSNELETWARKIGAAIVSTSQTIVAGGKFIVDHADALLFLAKAYAAVKIGGFLTDMASMASQTAAAGKGVTGLAGAFRLLPGNVQIAIALLGLDLAIKGATELGDAIGKNLPATKAWEERSRALNEETRQSAERYLQATATLERYRDIQIKTTAAVETMTGAEQARYAHNLVGLQEYLKAQITYYNTLRGIGQLNEEGEQHLTNLRGKLAEVDAALKSLQQSASIAADSIQSKLSANARQLVKDLEAAGGSSKKLGDTLEKAFATIETDSIQKVGDIGLAVAVVAKESNAAANAVRNGLAKSLRDLTGEDLLKFQSASIAAFNSVGLGVKDTSTVLETTLLVGMEKLGVAPEKFALGMSNAGKQAVAVFQAIIENAKATGAQIEAAFIAATRAATSREDVEALGAALQVAADQGRISLQGAERAGAALQNRIREIAAITSPLADAFGILGVKSQASLNATRDSAHDAFKAIADGAKRGEAAQYDVQRAFNAYAATAREAVEGSSRSIRDQVEYQLQAEAAASNVKLALVDMGDAGEKAGKRTAAGAQEATAALQETSSAADQLSESAEHLEEKSAGAASGLQNVAASGQAAADAAIGASEAFANAAQMGGNLDRVTFNLLDEQTRRYNEELAALNATNAAMDERAQIVSSLTAQYDLLSAAQIQTLANAKLEQQQSQQRQQEQQTRQREQQQATNNAGGGGGVTRVVVEHVVKGAGNLSAEQFKNQQFGEETARVLLPHLARLIQRGAPWPYR
jgi:tape measure domain-containing protein